MNTVQIAKWARQQIESQQWEVQDECTETRSVFLGTVFALDPCGRYHDPFGFNGPEARCVRFWESLERQLEKRGLSLDSGEGDPCDQFATESRDRDESEDTEDE